MEATVINDTRADYVAPAAVADSGGVGCGMPPGMFDVESVGGTLMVVAGVGPGVGDASTIVVGLGPGVGNASMVVTGVGDASIMDAGVGPGVGLLDKR